MDALLHFRKAWGGPISAVVVVGNAVEWAAVETYERDLATVLRDKTQLQIVRKMPHGFIEQSPNWLRNLALEQVRTQWVLTIDADLKLSRNMYSDLTNLLRNNHNLYNNNQRFAWVIPTWQFLPSKRLPKNNLGFEKSVLLDFYAKGLVKPLFGEQLNDHSEPTKSTQQQQILQPKHDQLVYDIQSWETATQPYEVDVAQFSDVPVLLLDLLDPCFPAYDERFPMHFEDRREHIFHLALRGWRFLVLPEAFLLRSPEPELSDDAPVLEHPFLSRLREHVIHERFSQANLEGLKDAQCLADTQIINKLLNQTWSR